MKVPAFILNMNKKSWSILKTDSQNLEENVSGNRTHECSYTSGPLSTWSLCDRRVVSNQVKLPCKRGLYLPSCGRYSGEDHQTRSAAGKKG
jgi:hypothetical protein